MGMTMSPRCFKFSNSKLYVLVIVILAVFYRIEAGDVCNEGCPPGGTKPGKLSFQPGQVYTYDLKSDVKIYLSGKPDNQEKTMSVTGVFEIYAETNCNYALKINSLQVKGPDRQAIRTGNDLQAQKLVRFTLSNDELSPEICVQNDDTEFGLNVKRALISMLQSADSKSYETDVFGICPTSFSKSQSGDTVTVVKTRNLNLCGHRESLSNGLITSVIDENSGVKSTPLLSGDYSSEQRFKAGILDNVQLSEEYHYVPFSSGEAGARVKVTTSIRKTKQSAGTAAKSGNVVPRTLLFENPNVQTIPKFGTTIERALKETIGTYTNNVGDKSAAKFSDLIRFMQFVKKDDLTQLFSKVKAGTVDSNKDLARKVYLDALFRAGTSDSMDATVALINEFTPPEKRIAFLSFNLVKNVNKDSLPSIAKLLDVKPVPPKDVYLSLGSLLNKYCRKHGCKAAETKAIFDKFTRKLNNCKANTHDEETTVVAVLKGIRNTQFLTTPIINQVIQCTADKKSTRIRVAALQTFSAASCDANVQNTALTLLKNREEDAELRIEAYLAYVACPSGTVANEVKKLLDTETVYQVGSFITSHLASVRSSTDPSRESVRQHFANVRSTQKFPVDLRRYSFNREYSYSVGSLGVGASSDLNVIYSQKSFLPRSARLNLTGELFGNSFNVFELSGRQENLDLLMEHNLGPKGLFQTANIQELYDTFFGDAKTKQKRSVRNDIKQFATTVNMGNDVSSDLDLDVTFKLFGTEMYFLSLGDNLSIDPKEFIHDIRKGIASAINNAKGFDNSYENHALFLDADLVYPTGTGFPLKLSALGTGVVRLETAGKIDFKDIEKNPSNTKFNLKVVPSYNFEIKGTISVDGFSVLTGLQVTGSVHSSTGAEVDFKMVDGGKGVDVDVRFPLTKQEIFKFDHKIVFVVQERGKDSIDTPLKFTSKINDFNGCFDQLNAYVGVTLCGGYSVSAPQVGGATFPLSGPNKVFVYVDVDSLYKFQVRVNNDNPKHRSIEFKFDTPGSANPRQTSLLLEAVTDPNYFARIALTSPIRSASVEAGLNNNDKEVVFYMDAKNGDEKYSAKLGFTKAGNPDHQEFTPILVWNTPKTTEDKFFGYKVNGKVVVDKRTATAKRYNFKQIQIVSNDKPITVNGWIDIDGEKFSNDLQITKDKYNGQFLGNFEFRPKYIIFDLGVTSNYHELLNGKLVLNVDYGDKYFSNKILVVYGPDLQSTTRRVELNHRYDYERDNNQLKSLKFEQKFKAPSVTVNYELDGEYNENLVKFEFEAGYGLQKVGSKLTAKRNVKTAGDYDVNFGITLNAHNAKLFMKREIEGSKSKISNRLTTSAGTKIELNGHIGHDVNAKNADISLEAVLVPIEKEEPYKCTLVILATPKKVTSNSKLLVGSTEWASYNLNVDRADDKNVNGDLTAKIKDTLEGKGSFKSTSGKGDGTFLLTLPKADRKFKISTVFNIAAPVYDLKTDFYYNFEKENDKKITFDTKNKISRGSFDSKNTLEIQADKYVFNTDGTSEGRAVDGKTNVRFQLLLPNQREISGNIDRELRLKQEVATGNIHVTLKDVLQFPSKKTRSFVLTGTLTDGDVRTKLFNLVHKATYTDFDGRDIVLSTQFKHLPKGEFKNGAAEINLRGSMLPEVIDFKISADEYCHEHAIYSASAKYGGQFNINVNGNYYVGGEKKPTTYDVKTVINVPNTQLKVVNLQSNGKFSTPQTDDDVYEGQFKVTGTLNDKVLAIDTTLKGNGKIGSGNLNVNVPNVEPFSVDGTYSLNVQETDGDGKGTLNIHYSKEKTIALSTDVKVAGGGNDVTIQVGLKTPFDNAKNVDYIYKRLSTGTSNTIHAEMKADDKRYALVLHTSVTRTNPKIDIVLSYPNNPDVKFYFEVNNLGDHKYSGKLNLENFDDFNFISSAEGSFQSVENYNLVLNVDSPKIKVDKVHIELNSKKGGKGIEFKATENGKNIVSGSADFTVLDQNGKIEIGGQGDVKFYDKQSTGNFKYVRTNFEEKRDKETGFMVIMNGNVDNKKLVAEFKWTNKNFYVKNSICQDNSKCSVIKIHSTLDQSELDFKHDLIVNVNLGSFGYTHDFMLTSSTDGSGFRLRHHTFDMQLKNKNVVTYQFKVDFRPTDSSVILLLPTRQVVFESVFKVPEDTYGKYEFRVSSYLDKKNSPNNVATIGFTADASRLGKNGVRSNYELKFAHPAIKDMKVYGKTELNGDEMFASGDMKIDIFKNPNQAIIISGKYDNIESNPTKAFNISTELSVKSPGLGFDYGFTGHAAASFDRRQLSVGGSLVSPTPDLRASIFFYSTERNFEFIATSFNQQLINVDGSFDVDSHKGKLIATLKYLNSAPFVFDGSVNGYSSIKGNLKRDRFIDVTGEITAGKEASLLVNGQNKQLFRANIALDQTHFLKSEYKVDDAQIKEFLKFARQEMKNDAENGKKAMERRFADIRKGLEDQMSRIKNAAPDFDKFVAEYKREGQKVVDELKADETVKKLIDFYNRFYESIGKSIEEVVKTLIEHVKKVQQILTEFYNDLLQAFNEKILPALKDTYTNVERIIMAFLDEAVRLIGDFVERCVQTLKAFEEDFGKIGATVSEQFKKIAALFNKYFDTIRKEVNDLYQILVDNIKQLPAFDEVKNRLTETLGEWIAPEQLSQLVKALSTFLQEILPTDQLDEFIKNVETYIDSKLTSKKVNDIDELKKIYVSLVKAIRSVIDIIRAQSGDTDLSKTNFWFPIPFSFDALKRLPTVSNFKFSPWNFIRSEKRQSLADFLKTYRPYAWNPINFLPPYDKHGTIADGQHIFTFDGRHMTFPGTCQYILAQDFVNNNFSVVANLDGGKLKSITLVDKDDSVEISPGGIAKLNDKPSELPIDKANIHAWRRYYTLSFLSLYGVFVQCGLDMRVCHISVNGYYHGKLRGILGNGNSEPFDDFTLPNGHIATDSAQLGNAYKATSSCADVKFDEHKGEKSDECSSTFGSDSSMRYCYYLIDHLPYREACEHAVHHATDKKDAACNIALTYASACRMENIPVNAPESCVRCSAKHAVGDAYSEVVPQKVADVVFVVDLALGAQTLTDLIQPAATILRTQLKNRDIQDVNVAIIGFRKDIKYPYRFTTNGKLDFTGKLAMPDDKDLVKEPVPLKTGKEKLDKALLDAFNYEQKVKDDLGIASDGRAFQEALRYPFRSTAVRTIIAFRSNHLTHSLNPLKQLGGTVINSMAKREGIHVHMIGPMESLKVNNEKNNKIVGFGTDSVIQIGKNKAKSAETREKLTYDPDLGIDLVQANNGYVFSLTNFNELKEKKSFIQQMTAAIADDMARTEWKFECECVLRYGLFAYEKCQQVETRTLPPAVKSRG